MGPDQPKIEYVFAASNNLLGRLPTRAGLLGGPPHATAPREARNLTNTRDLCILGENAKRGTEGKSLKVFINSGLSATPVYDTVPRGRSVVPSGPGWRRRQPARSPGSPLAREGHL